jgi:hypothetical protein
MHKSCKSNKDLSIKDITLIDKYSKLYKLFPLVLCSL